MIDNKGLNSVRLFRLAANLGHDLNEREASR